MRNRAQSTKIIKHLKANKLNTTFTASELVTELQGDNISSGAISGLVAKLAKSGLLKSDGQRPKQYYIVGDLSTYRARKYGSVGSTTGRTLHRPKQQIIEDEYIRNANLEVLIDKTLADLMEIKQVLGSLNLTHIPTGALLKELTSRIKEGAK